MGFFNELKMIVRSVFKTRPSDFHLPFTMDDVVEMEYFPFDGYKAMMMAGMLIHRKGSSPVDNTTLRHESIHLAQAKDCGSWTKYYANYIWHWLKLNPLRHTYVAYYCNKYELEAYAKEYELEYLTRRERHAVERFTLKEPRKAWDEFADRFTSFVKDYFILF